MPLEAPVRFCGDPVGEAAHGLTDEVFQLEQNRDLRRVKRMSVAISTTVKPICLFAK